MIGEYLLQLHLLQLQKYPHLHEYFKKSKIDIELVWAPSFDYSIEKDKCINSNDAYIVNDNNELVWNDKVITGNIKPYLKEQAEELQTKSRKLIMYLCPYIKDNIYRLCPVEDIEERYQKYLRSKRIKRMLKFGKNRTRYMVKRPRNKVDKYTLRGFKFVDDYFLSKVLNVS